MKSISIKDLIWFGRNLDYKGVRYFDYSASAFEFCFTGKKASAVFLSDPSKWSKANQAVLGVFVKEIKDKKLFKGNSYWENCDSESAQKIFLNKAQAEYVLFQSPVEKTVIIKVVKLSEAAFGMAGLKSLKIDGNLNKPVAAKNKAFKIEFIGDSITCGYGVEGINEKDDFTTAQERADKSFAYLSAQKLNAEFNCVSWSGIGLVSKYVDESIDVPDTTISMPLLWPYTDKSLSLRLGLEPEVWDEARFSPDLVVINLGTNDMSFTRGREDRVKLYTLNLRVFLEEIHRRSPKAKLCCCLGVMGQELCDAMKKAVTLFKKDFPGVEILFIKLPLQDEKKDGAGANWHPSYKTQKKTADYFVKKLSSFI